jgi:glycosyltransferase involved in cell wall biosynthesis
MKKSLTIVCDAVLSDFGPLRPAILIAKQFAKKGHNVKILSTIITENMKKRLESQGISSISLRRKTLFKDESLAWFQLWFEEALLSRNSRKIHEIDGIVINFSNSIAVPSEIWYAQGPPTVTLDNMQKYLPWHYKILYSLSATFLKHKDKTLNKKFAQLSKKIIVNSYYLSTIYRKFGLKVHGVIYPPLDCNEFKPTTNQPTNDYVLTYFGKETKFPIIKALADKKIKIKAFGSKLTSIPKSLQTHPYIEALGHVSTKSLVNLYSNALFTLYSFSDEPFGYIPIESMACGTPVLTFNRQGPRESILQNATGWLVENDKQMINLAVEIWKQKYSSVMRKACRKRALLFDTKNISKKWFTLLKYCF